MESKKQKLYTSIWESELERIIQIVSSNESKSYPLNPQLFEDAGNRKHYNFSMITFLRGKIQEIPGNSAVARDLIDVLEESIKFREVSKNKSVKIRLSKSFELFIETKLLVSGKTF